MITIRGKYPVGRLRVCGILRAFYSLINVWSRTKPLELNHNHKDVAAEFVYIVLFRQNAVRDGFIVLGILKYSDKSAWNFEEHGNRTDVIFYIMG